MTGGQVALPVTIRMANGGGAGFAAQHSQAAENWFLNVPGLKIVVPGTPADAYGLLRAAVEDPDPVLFFEHKGAVQREGELPDAPAVVELGRAEVVRAGEDCTVVASQLMRHRAIEAAELLAGEDVCDRGRRPPHAVPFDHETVGASLDQTNRLIVAQEGPPGGSWGASLIAKVVQERLEILDAPPLLIAPDEVPVPYASTLEAAYLPSAERIAGAVRRTLAY